MNSAQQPIKPLFCVDITTDKKNTTINGNEFISASISEQTKRNYENTQDAFEDTVQKAKLPKWLKIIELACAFVFFVVCMGVIRAGFDVGFDKAFNNAPALIIIGIICGIIWITLHIVSKSKAKKVFEEENIEQKAENIITDIDNMFRELNVPDNAVDIEVLTFRYKIKKNEICPYESAMQMTPFFNISLKAYVTDGKINLADAENVYSFDKSAMKAITTVNKQISIHEWNKDLPPTDRAYSSFNIKTNDKYGLVYFKPYHILEIERNGEKYGIYFPCYEIDAIERLTQLKAEK